MSELKKRFSSRTDNQPSLQEVDRVAEIIRDMLADEDVATEVGAANYMRAVEKYANEFKIPIHVAADRIRVMAEEMHEAFQVDDAEFMRARHEIQDIHDELQSEG